MDNESLRKANNLKNKIEKLKGFRDKKEYKFLKSEWVAWLKDDARMRFEKMVENELLKEIVRYQDEFKKL